MPEDTGWMVNVRVKPVAVAHLPKGISRVNLAGSNLAAVSLELGVDQIILFNDPESNLGKVLLSFDPTAVTELMSNDLQQFTAEALRRLGRELEVELTP